MKAMHFIEHGQIWGQMKGDFELILSKNKLLFPDFI